MTREPIGVDEDGRPVELDLNDTEKFAVGAVESMEAMAKAISYLHCRLTLVEKKLDTIAMRKWD